MLTAIFHFLYAIASFIIGLLILFFVWTKKTKLNNNVVYFAYFFILFAVYRILLASYLFIDDIFLIKEFYIIGIIVFFGMITLMELVALKMLQVEYLMRKIIFLFMFLLTSVVTFLQVYNFRLPIINRKGFVLWNMDIWSSWITSLSGFMVAMTWAYVFSRNIMKGRNKTDKIKNHLIVITAIFLGIASLAYFHSNYYSLIIAFFSAFGGIISMVIFLIISFLNNVKDKKTNLQNFKKINN